MSARAIPSLESIVSRHRIVVCAGSGGVGKTTTAAAIAFYGALSGRRAIVLTIDPARRLADSLGVGPIGNTPSHVPAATFERLNLTLAGGLSAMMLDQKGSWDELVARHAPSDAVRDRILENRFYRELSQSFAGSQEYMAVEQLGELSESGLYDLIVVDTPPSQHALDFLEAPERLLDFLDRKVVKWFVRPSVTAGWSAFRTMNKTVGFLLHKIEEATGVSALSEVSDFFDAMSGLFDGFEQRVARVLELLRDSKTAFVLVAAPDEQVLEQVEYLAEQMSQKRMPLKGVVMNRVRRPVERNGFSVDASATIVQVFCRLLPEIDPALATRLAENFVRYQARARGDALRIENFRQGLPRGIPLVVVPNLSSDVHDLSGLLSLHPHLFGSRGEVR